MKLLGADGITSEICQVTGDLEVEGWRSERACHVCME